ncbi:hypothetical protein, partial [Escherichia coli]|uniref:hypothetical protein n=1 Tax=Escherichia coli TaxID=562 RepID=UPI00215B7649
IPLCCDTAFNPNDTVKTFLGSGIVDSASFNLKDETLDLELLYDAFGVLTGNEPPTISGGSLFTYKDLSTEFDINATDSD